MTPDLLPTESPAADARLPNGHWTHCTVGRLLGDSGECNCGYGAAAEMHWSTREACADLVENAARQNGDPDWLREVVRTLRATVALPGAAEIVGRR